MMKRLAALPQQQIPQQLTWKINSKYEYFCYFIILMIIEMMIILPPLAATPPPAAARHRNRLNALNGRCPAAWRAARCAFRLVSSTATVTAANGLRIAAKLLAAAAMWRGRRARTVEPEGGKGEGQGPEPTGHAAGEPGVAAERQVVHHSAAAGGRALLRDLAATRQFCPKFCPKPERLPSDTC